MRRVATWLMTCAICMSLSIGAHPADEQPVDVQLVLAVDTSLSMTREELEIQRAGYASALTHPAVLAAIRTGFYGQVAMTFVEWSGTDQQRVVVPWHLVATREDAAVIAGQIRAERQPGWRRTSISSALQFAAQLFAGNGFSSDRKIIDLSGDGPNNAGVPVTFARDSVVRQGITINGLPLMTGLGYDTALEFEALDRYYEECVIGGPGAFVMPVAAWEEFAETVRRKLVLELSGAEPSPRMQRVSGAIYDCLVGEKLWQQRRFYFGP